MIIQIPRESRLSTHISNFLLIQMEFALVFFEKCAKFIEIAKLGKLRYTTTTTTTAD